MNEKMKRLKKLTDKKNIDLVNFEAREQFTPSALESLIRENDLLIKSLKKPGEIDIDY